MSLHMMLTVDLKNATSNARAVFDAKMAEKKWSKSPNVTTTWTAIFSADAPPQGAINATKTDVADAARQAGIMVYEAVCLPSVAAPAPFRGGR